MSPKETVSGSATGLAGAGNFQSSVNPTFSPEVQVQRLASSSTSIFSNILPSGSMFHSIAVIILPLLLERPYRSFTLASSIASPHPGSDFPFASSPMVRLSVPLIGKAFGFDGWNSLLLPSLPCSCAEMMH